MSILSQKPTDVFPFDLILKCNKADPWNVWCCRPSNGYPILSGILIPLTTSGELSELLKHKSECIPISCALSSYHLHPSSFPGCWEILIQDNRLVELLEGRIKCLAVFIAVIRVFRAKSATTLLESCISRNQRNFLWFNINSIDRQ